VAKQTGVINKAENFICFNNAMSRPVIHKNKNVGFICLNPAGKQLTIPGNIVFNEISSLIDLEATKKKENEQPMYVVTSFHEKLKLEELGINNIICNVYGKSLLTKAQYRAITTKNDKDVFFIFENTAVAREDSLNIVKSFFAGWSPNHASQIKILFIPKTESLSSIVRKISIDKLGLLESKAIDLPSIYVKKYSESSWE
jgi:hypothetical protein